MTFKIKQNVKCDLSEIMFKLNNIVKLLTRLIVHNY